MRLRERVNNDDRRRLPETIPIPSDGHFDVKVSIDVPLILVPIMHPEFETFPGISNRMESSKKVHRTKRLQRRSSFFECHLPWRVYISFLNFALLASWRLF